MASSELSPILPTSNALPSSRRPLPVWLAWFCVVSAALLVLHPPADNPSTTTLFPTPRNLLSQCQEKFITQQLDHFRANGSTSDGSFDLRYFICASELFDPHTGAIFFYVGNEADVTLYLNHTGLMWENAAAFNALLVFAEHRYFGKSVPFGLDVLDHLEFLSSQQALADYAVLIEQLKKELNADVPVIGFGGSYGGMLGTWFRMKYPHVIDGVIAGSAPVVGFLGDPDHPADTEGFNRVVTFDMSEDAGSAPNCVPNARRALKAAVDLAETEEGRRAVAKIFKLCDETSLQTPEDIISIVAEAYGDLAMGNYPYPTSYIMDGNSDLPGYPMRAACEPLGGDFADEDTENLIAALRDSVAVYYNNSKTETCLLPAAPDTTTNSTLSSDEAKQAEIDRKGNFWGYLYCSELYMPSGSDGVHDIYPAAPANLEQDDAACVEQWGVHLKPYWAQTEYGGMKAIHAASNIVFSNGNFDPWSATGVLKELSPSVVTVPVPGGAHHLDLFFTHPLDPPEVMKARQTELAYIRKWINEFYAYKHAEL